MTDELVHTHAIRLRCFGETSEGTATIERFSKSYRIRRAITAGAVGLGATIVCLFIPLAHFILVPLGLLVTPLLVMTRYGQTSIVRTASGACPKCGVALSVTDVADRWPLSCGCDGCRRSVSMMLE